MDTGTDIVDLHWMWRETSNRLDVLSRRVEEGKDVLAASEFCRWLGFSGILKLFERNPHDLPLKVDGPFLRWKCDELLLKCATAYDAKGGVVRLDVSELENVNRKLDIIAAHVSKLSPSSTEIAESAGESAVPVFQVIQGGR